jgi:predicted anti-sigma-YlaC factor YlaD
MHGDPHQEFQELCALSTTGELTVEEWMRLTEHLAHCDSCRKASKEYDRLIAMALPALGVESDSDLDREEGPGAWSIEDAEQRLMESLEEEPLLE